MLLNSLKGTEQPFQLRMIWSEMPVVLRFRNPGLGEPWAFRIFTVSEMNSPGVGQEVTVGSAPR